MRILGDGVARLLPPNATVLDVGCGDGYLADRISRLRPDVSIRGVDVLVRPNTLVPVELFDGQRLPAGDCSVDVVLFVDVLHHTEDPAVLLAEAARVARKGIVIKDHLADTSMAARMLRVMDWVGNAPHGVRLPYNYWSHSRWLAAFESLGLVVEDWSGALGLYPPPGSWIFERRLHYLARLRPSSRGTRA